MLWLNLKAYLNISTESNTLWALIFSWLRYKCKKLSLYLQCSLTLKTDWKKTENAFEDHILTQDRANESLSNVFNRLNFISLDVTST